MSASSALPCRVFWGGGGWGFLQHDHDLLKGLHFGMDALVLELGGDWWGADGFPVAEVDA